MHKGYLAIGVVFRGKMFLDGVFTSHASEGESLNLDVCRMIRDSKHFNQIRVIIFENNCVPPNESLDPFFLFEETGKPVLQLSMNKEIDERYMFKWRNWTIYSAGLGKKDAIKVLDTSTQDNDYPEVLKISNLISKALHNI
jgi:endonuclease V-like protein UPF0215 family